jgi:Cdc6-like AAA superfamily ATPase
MLDLSGMSYADGAGLDTTKQCLPGTRTEILSKITEWVNSTDDVPRVLWLSGLPGVGKSAIAHTIAKWCNDFGVNGSCYTLDRQADQRDKKIFSTIARDLADRDPEMKRALANAVRDARALKATPDILQQWQKLLVEPIRMSLIKEPIVIVIDALDESGAETRKHLLRILAGKQPDVSKITDLPPNLRFIVTSRPEPDIIAEFQNVSHIKYKSMDDTLESAVADIRKYVSNELSKSDFEERHFTILANRANGLFEWARLACEYIKEPPLGQSQMDFYEAVISPNPDDRHKLLYDTYTVILKGIMPEDAAPHDQHSQKSRSIKLARFRSVMGQILHTAEPSPLASLNAMRSHFPIREDVFDMTPVVKSMGSLLSGITNPNSPIRPLHASFRDFLTDKSYSGDFFIDLSKVQRDLAFASLRVMEHGLRFNICKLQSSYLPNSDDSGLQGRVQICISPDLSYSSRFWTSHVRAAVFDEELAREVKLFFDHERLFFWLELLALLNALSGAVPALNLIPQWLEVSTLLLSAR